MTTTRRIATWLTDHRLTVDVVAVVLLGPLLVLGSQNLTVESPSRWVYVWAAAGVLPLAVRRHAPVASAITVFTVSAVQVAVGPSLLLPANLAVLVSLYSVTVYGPRWAGRTAMAGIVAGASVFGGRLLLEWGSDYLAQAATFGGLMVVTGSAVWAFAMLRRARVETLEALRDRATRLERERDQQALIAAAAERSRIAREMHDVVAHSLAIVVAQADGGRYAARHDPAAAVPVLTTISDTGRAALADVRRILGVLRDGTDAAAAALPSPTDGVPPWPVPAATAPRSPQPAQADLGDLLANVRAAGLEVSFEEDGTPVTLPAALQLTVHRVLQEALTNVLKHAGPAPSVAVARRWSADLLVLEVTDDGRGAASDPAAVPGGLGLLGMRERVALFGGELEAGPRDGGGFRVRAVLPVTGDATTTQRLEAEQPAPTSSLLRTGGTTTPASPAAGRPTAPDPRGDRR